MKLTETESFRNKTIKQTTLQNPTPSVESNRHRYQVYKRQSRSCICEHFIEASKHEAMDHGLAVEGISTFTASVG